MITRQFHSHTHQVRIGTHSDSQRDLGKCLREICLHSFLSGPKSGSQGHKIRFPPPASSFLDWDQALRVSAPETHALFFPAPYRTTSCSLSPDLRTQRHPKGICGREGGAWSKGSVGRGCASRGAWAEGGWGHEETRGQWLATQTPK